MKIQHEDDGINGRFYIDRDGETLAEMTYKWYDSHIDINHTGVSDELRGQGIGAKLVAVAVEWARQRYIKISASCPFAKAILARKEEYSDVYFV